VAVRMARGERGGQITAGGVALLEAR